MMKPASWERASAAGSAIAFPFWASTALMKAPSWLIAAPSSPRARAAAAASSLAVRLASIPAARSAPVTSSSSAATAAAAANGATRRIRLLVVM